MSKCVSVALSVSTFVQGDPDAFTERQSLYFGNFAFKIELPERSLYLRSFVRSSSKCVKSYSNFDCCQMYAHFLRKKALLGDVKKIRQI